MVSLRSSQRSGGGDFFAEARRIVQDAKDRGLIRDSNTARPIDKSGEPAAAEAGVRSQWMDVDPATAARWLENNFVNRPVSEDAVVAYARDMTTGQWVPTHQGIAFNDRDELIDGQHRLRAVVLSGMTIRMMVTFGLRSVIEGREMTTMDAVDRGRTRSVADQLKIQHGMKDGAIIAGICGQLANLCRNDRTRRLSVGQTLTILRAFEAPALWVIERRSKAIGLRGRGVLAGFVFALTSDGADFEGGDVARMFVQLNEGTAKAGSAIALLHEFLVSDDAKLLGGSSDRALAELVLQAIHQQRAGTKLKKLEPGLEGADHFRGLQAERVREIASIFALPQ